MGSMDHEHEFSLARQKLFLAAYRLTGSVSDAEDVLQDTYIRWLKLELDQVNSSEAMLMTIVSRLCIDHLRAQQRKRESYAGIWLPEALNTQTLVPSAEEKASADETLSMGFLVLLEKLNSVERAVYVLREVFDYSYTSLAEVVERSEGNCRKIFQRASSKINHDGVGSIIQHPTSFEQQKELLTQFVVTCSNGDLAALEALFTKDITLWSDGGDHVKTAPNIIHGATSVARFLMGVIDQTTKDADVTLVEINGSLAITIAVHGQLFGAVSFDYSESQIATVRLLLNTEKLGDLLPTE